jgi:hypothetical protein
MPRTFIFLCVSMAILISIVPAFGQSDSKTASPPTGPVANETGSTNSNLLQSELSSAALAPCVYVGTANFGQTMMVNVADATGTWSSTATISLNPSSYVCTPTTCTWILSSQPPGPATISLNTSLTPKSIQVDSTTGVVTDSNWFPLSGGQFNPSASIQVTLTATGAWFSKTTDPTPKTTTYPALEWSPGYVTIIYQ